MDILEMIVLNADFADFAASGLSGLNVPIGAVPLLGKYQINNIYFVIYIVIFYKIIYFSTRVRSSHLDKDQTEEESCGLPICRESFKLFISTNRPLVP